MKNNKSNVKPTNLDLDVFSIEELPPEGNLQLPTPELVTKYKFLKDRRLFITQDIDDSIMEFTKNLIMWNMEDEQNNIPIEDRKPVYIYILSYGGQLDQIMTLIDVINLSKMKIKTINLGVCASAGCLLLMSGTKGERYAVKNSWGLVHQGSGGASGTASMVEAQTQNYKKILEMVKKLILEKTNITPTQYSKKKLQEWYVYGEDMIKLGIVDHIVDDITQII